MLSSPTGVLPQGLTDAEQKVYDLIARRFIAAFYPDCKFSTTTVLGEVDKIEFKVSGKEILDLGWRVCIDTSAGTTSTPLDEEQEGAATGSPLLPNFKKGESGPHTPTLTEKLTTPPSTTLRPLYSVLWNGW